MKFLGGFITGVIATILVLSVMLGSMTDNTPRGLIIFPEKGECITKNDLTVFQALEPNMALVLCGKSVLDDQLVLLINYDDKHYYDGELIRIPSGMCAKQIGTYQYTTKEDILKTVPAVTIE